MSTAAILDEPAAAPAVVEEESPPERARPRRFRRRRPYVWLGLAVFAALLALRSWQYAQRTLPPEMLDEGPHQVAEIIDGDTLRLANKAVVRLVGADAPYLPSPGRAPNRGAIEAAEFTRQFIGDQPVRLVFDRERLDRQGHFLAYVYVWPRYLNEELLRAGLARVRMPASFSASRKRVLDQAEREAREARRGIWSTSGGY
jgi:micrococcal nuclease